MFQLNKKKKKKMIRGNSGLLTLSVHRKIKNRRTSRGKCHQRGEADLFFDGAAAELPTQLQVFRVTRCD